MSDYFEAIGGIGDIFTRDPEAKEAKKAFLSYVLRHDHQRVPNWYWEHLNKLFPKDSEDSEDSKLLVGYGEASSLRWCMRCTSPSAKDMMGWVRKYPELAKELARWYPLLYVRVTGPDDWSAFVELFEFLVPEDTTFVSPIDVLAIMEEDRRAVTTALRDDQTFDEAFQYALTRAGVVEGSSMSRSQFLGFVLIWVSLTNCVKSVKSWVKDSKVLKMKMDPTDRYVRWRYGNSEEEPGSFLVPGFTKMPEMPPQPALDAGTDVWQQHLAAVRRYTIHLIESKSEKWGRDEERAAQLGVSFDWSLLSGWLIKFLMGLGHISVLRRA